MKGRTSNERSDVTTSDELRLVMQRRGMSATHAILVLPKGEKVIVCSVTSEDGRSSFDYSIILPRTGVPIEGTDEDIVESLCKTENHLQSSWGWDLALENGIKEENIMSAKEFIDIANPRLIRLSRATRIASSEVKKE